MYKKCVTHLVLLNIFTPASSWRERLFWPIKVIPGREFNYDRGKVLFEKYLNPWYSAHVHVNCVWGRDWWRPIQTAPASWRAAMNWGWEKHTEREATPKKKPVYIWALPKLRFDPPSGHFGAQRFCRKWEGQRWFWYGILIEIKVNIGEIWWKLGGLVRIIFTEELLQDNSQIHSICLRLGLPLV